MLNFISAVMTAAQKVGVSASLLVAICAHESNWKNVVVPHDGGSPSYGICQIKQDTAKMLGFKGKPSELMRPSVNAYYAAKYLKYQEERYGEDWCKIAAAYNAGSYNESMVVPGKPRNLKYVRRVQAKIDSHLKHRLSCESPRILEADVRNFR